MKKSMLSFALAAVFTTGMFLACNDPSETKTNEAQKNADKAQQELRDAEQAAEKAKASEDKAAYKADCLKKIAANQERIAELRAKEKTSGKKTDEILRKRIDALEKRNAELKDKVNKYEDTSEAKWEEFKRELNHDMEELGKAISDIGKDNVK